MRKFFSTTRRRRLFRTLRRAPCGMLPLADPGHIVGGYVNVCVSEDPAGAFRGALTVLGLILDDGETIPAATTAVMNDYGERVYFSFPVVCHPGAGAQAFYQLRTKRSLRRGQRLVIVFYADGTGASTTIVVVITACIFVYQA